MITYSLLFGVNVNVVDWNKEFSYSTRETVFRICAQSFIFSHETKHLIASLCITLSLGVSGLEECLWACFPLHAPHPLLQVQPAFPAAATIPLVLKENFEECALAEHKQGSENNLCKFICPVIYFIMFKVEKNVTCFLCLQYIQHRSFHFKAEGNLLIKNQFSFLLQGFLPAYTFIFLLFPWLSDVFTLVLGCPFFF